MNNNQVVLGLVPNKSGRTNELVSAALEGASRAGAAIECNAVNLIAGTNVTLKTGTSTVAGNTTVTMYCELDNITLGSETATIY